MDINCLILLCFNKDIVKNIKSIKNKRYYFYYYFKVNLLIIKRHIELKI